MNEFLYTGDSTAFKAFETPDGNDELSQLVSIGKLLEVSTGKKMIDVSHYARPNTRLADYVLKINKQAPVIWLFACPVASLFWREHNNAWPAIHSSNTDLAYELITAVNYNEIYNQIANDELNVINNIGLPIGLIGGSGDISEEQIVNYKNLSIIHPSWYQYLAKAADIPLQSKHMLAELLHVIVNIFFPAKGIVWNQLWQVDRNFYNNIPVNQSLIDDIYKIYSWREAMHNARYICHNHPNVKSNVLFHNLIKDKAKDYLNDNTK